MNRLTEWMNRRGRVLVMGILNVTPDSFHDGGRFEGPTEAVEAALRMEAAGADIIDIGGESTRPGSDVVSAEEEAARVLPVIRTLRERSDVLISVDTAKAVVAEAALAAGAVLVNDVSALRSDVRMAEVVAEANGFVALMHMQGSPKTMQENPTYDDVVEDVRTFLAERIDAAIDAGISSERILIDPGIGFGKHLSHNLELLRRLDRLVELGPPVLVGLSRKSFLGRLLDLPSTDRLEGTIAANAVAIAHGAEVIRVHDVAEGRRTADVAVRLRRHGH